MLSNIFGYIFFVFFRLVFTLRQHESAVFVNRLLSNCAGTKVRGIISILFCSKQRQVLIIPPNLNSVLLLLRNSKLAYCFVSCCCATNFGMISVQVPTSLCMQNKLIIHSRYCFVEQYVYPREPNIYMGNLYLRDSLHRPHRYSFLSQLSSFCPFVLFLFPDPARLFLPFYPIICHSQLALNADPL